MEPMRVDARWKEQELRPDVDHGTLTAALVLPNLNFPSFGRSLLAKASVYSSPLSSFLQFFYS